MTFLRVAKSTSSSVGFLGEELFRGNRAMAAQILRGVYFSGSAGRQIGCFAEVAFIPISSHLNHSNK